MGGTARLSMALFCCFLFPGFAQQGAFPSPVAPPAEGATVLARGDGRRISLDVVVTDKSGKPVPGLQQQDFTLLDDKQPQTILSFRATDETSRRLILRCKPFCSSMQSTLRSTA
jgi:hypothetical protein